MKREIGREKQKGRERKKEREREREREKKMVEMLQDAVSVKI